MISALALAIAQNASENYSFSVNSASLLRGGRINRNYLVRTDGKSAVLRVYPAGRRANQIEFEMSVMTHLFSLGCRVPSPLKSQKGEILGSLKLDREDTDSSELLQGALFVWLSFIDATPLEPQVAFELPVDTLSELLDPIFDALATFVPPFSPAPETRIFRRSLPPLLTALQDQNQSTFASRLSSLFEQLTHWEKEASLPSGVMHGDIHPGNILRKGRDSQLTLIDFDDGHVGTRALDWVLTALEFSWNASNTLDENRYTEVLHRLTRARVSHEEEEAFPLLRTLLTLKCACNEHALGQRLESNRYLKLLQEG